MTRRLFLLPLEPLAERYTEAWYKWLPQFFSQSFTTTVIPGEALTDSVQVGAFLDLNSTVHYKMKQLASVARLFSMEQVKSGDAFFVADIEFWGVEAIRYMARLQDIDVKIFGFLHAASYTPGDFMVPMADIGRWVEVAWIETCDLVFLGSVYHQDLLIRKRLKTIAPHLLSRLKVTGNPWRTREAKELVRKGLWFEKDGRRDFDVLFPHRPDAEKRPARFLDFMEGFRGQVAFTTGRKSYRSTNDPETADRIRELGKGEWVHIFTGLKRADFYSVCSRAKVTVSTAEEETFGYAMVEAMAQGSLPLMPNALSYPELVGNDSRFLYRDGDREDFLDKLSSLLFLEGEEHLNAQIDILGYCERLDGAEQRILESMENCK